MQDKHYIPTKAGLKQGDAGEDVQRLQNYLSKFGYIESPNDAIFGTTSERTAASAPEAPGAFDDNTRRALESFQRFAGVEVTGRLDEPTLRMMQAPRCGVPDSAAFVIDGRKWDHTDLTYTFAELTEDLTPDEIRDAIRQALDLWEGVTVLRFREVGAGQNPDIIIRFVSRDHGDFDGFDGAGGTLAHAFFPPPNAGDLAGDAHFDDDETWSVDLPASGTDLVTVAAHELGHSLGLAHSQFRSALMFPFYDGPNRRLGQDDIDGIRQLYDE
ncbi:MAG TPA: matrixin family metalloprotease [Pyrinomonadaceae bacterium]|jgi:hypothetical protein|nr:matrixin family metalloprotease [Pyrinomonadaceae bacterium]